jgi:hypothetical protein
VLDALELSDAEIGRIAQAARARTLEEHTSLHRAVALIEILENAHSSTGAAQAMEGA